VNYCCTLLHKSVLDSEDYSNRNDLNHLIYAEQHLLNHSLSFAIITFLSVVRCRKEIDAFYRENEHFRELLNTMKHKYGPRSEFLARDPAISNALSQVANVMFDRHQRKKKRHHHHHHYHFYEEAEQLNDFIKPFPDSFDRDEFDDSSQYQRCGNSSCQLIENDVRTFEFQIKNKRTIFVYSVFLANEISTMSSLSKNLLLQSILS